MLILTADDVRKALPMKEAIEAIRHAKEQLEQAHREAERAERDADLQRAAELRYGEIPELEQLVREQ